MTVELDAQVEAVCAARAILRSELPHKVSDIRLACITMQRFGDGLDYVEARHMLQALRPVKPPYSPQVSLIRAAMVDCAGLAVIAALAASVYLEVWK